MVNLDLGCGLNKQKSYLGIDIRKNSDANIIADLESLPIKNNCVTQVIPQELFNMWKTVIMFSKKFIGFSSQDVNLNL